MRRIADVRSALLRAQVTRLRVAPLAGHRVLVLDEHPTLPSGIDALLAAHLGRAGLPVDVDAIRAPSAALRVIRADRHALDRYDAIIAITSPLVGRLGAATALHREAGLLAERLPTLLVQVEPTRSDRTRRRAAAGERGQAAVLRLPAAGSLATTARRIADAAQALLERIEPSESRARHPSHEPAGPDVVQRRLAHITRLTTEAFELAGAAVTIRRGDRLATLAESGAPLPPVRFADSFCAIALGRPGITVIPDTRLDPDSSRLRAAGVESVRFYAAVPIHGPDGTAVGALGVHDPEPHHEPDLDFSLLQDLALLAEGELLHAAPGPLQPEG